MEAPQVEGLLVSGESSRRKVEAKSKRKKVRCFKGGEWGHVKKECRGKEARRSVEERRQVLMLSVGDSDNDSNLLWSV